MFGRPPRAEEVEQNCWVLTPFCHLQKTSNAPSAKAWLERFIAHCVRYRYTEARERAEKALAWRLAKGTTA